MFFKERIHCVVVFGTLITNRKNLISWYERNQ